MSWNHRFLAICFCTLLVGADILAQTPFQIEETTISRIHVAIKTRTLTCHDLVQLYLDRIDAYDKRGPAINALITINLKALSRADELDAEFAIRGLTGPLHCIPFIVKDNFNTAGLETTAGSLALAGMVPTRDAFQVRRILEAGAIVLAKANLSEFASSGVETVSSRLPGYTRNPYALDRVTAGSSGGTAAAVAANFGTVGLGSDTEDSIRGPSSHTSLVGIRSTMGLTSRSGIVPLDLDRDIGGPMARTVADAVTVFDVIAGPDPDDPITQASRGKMPTGGYTQFLRPNGLRGARLGVLRYVMGPTADPEVVRLFDRAIADLKRQGASVVDPVSLPELEKTPNVYTQGEDLVWTRCSPFKYQLHDYLANVGPNAPVHDVDEVIKSGKFHPSIEWLLRAAQLSPKPPHDDSACEPVRTETRELRRLLARTLDGGRLDALVYPSWSNPPRLIGDLNTPGGENSGRFSPPTGFPAITVPMGYARDFLPIGLEFVGASWSEATLFRLAYSYEHATNHRRAPAIVPALATGSKVLAK